MEASLGVAVCSVVPSQVPDDQGLVTTGRQEHVRAASIVRISMTFEALAASGVSARLSLTFPRR